MKKIICVFTLLTAILLCAACNGALDVDDLRNVYSHSLDISDLQDISLNYRYGIFVSSSDYYLQITEHEQSLNGNLDPLVRHGDNEFSMEGVRRYYTQILLPPGYQGKLSFISEEGAVWCDMPLDVQSLHVQSGNLLYLMNVQGQEVQLSCLGGEMIIRQLSGNFEISSISAKMKIDMLGGAGSISNVAGGIIAGLDEITGTVNVETISGDIFITVPQSLSFTLVANTATGELNIEEGYSSAAENGMYIYGESPQGMLNITSVTGNITVLRQ